MSSSALRLWMTCGCACAAPLDMAQEAVFWSSASGVVEIVERIRRSRPTSDGREPHESSAGNVQFLVRFFWMRDDTNRRRKGWRSVIASSVSSLRTLVEIVSIRPRLRHGRAQSARRDLRRNLGIEMAVCRSALQAFAVSSDAT